jgi:hypothetical protein
MYALELCAVGVKQVKHVWPFYLLRKLYIDTCAIIQLLNDVPVHKP